MRTCGNGNEQRGQNPGSKTENGRSNGCCGGGKIYVIGLGPGDREYIAPAAMEALRKAEFIVGYNTYISLIEDIVKDKGLVSTGMRKERERAKKAVELAREGHTVGVVSGGDPGVYGMAGIVLELADNKVDVEIIPGITAATAAASLLGSPLMHDFAVISLSDLLTPWNKIITRLEAAAMADMVIVLYNPKSKGRREHIKAAREIILWHREPETPVGIVRCAKRGREKVMITTLREMLDHEIDMLTTVIVGNSETKVENDRMITPRGYSL